MASRIIRFSVEGSPALGFDTGLNSAAFAQARLAQLIGPSGHIVCPDGTVQDWKSGGVVEWEGTMVIWGPPFWGERLDRILSGDTRQDKALDALRYWIQARLALGSPDHPWPAEAIIAFPEEGGEGPGTFPPGTIFFPPERLLRRAVEAEGSGAWAQAAERWVHPDLTGDQEAFFAAGTMLYRVFCGAPPFPEEDPDTFRQDMREGVFLPCRLAEPALREDLALLIDRSISPAGKRGGSVLTRPVPSVHSIPSDPSDHSIPSGPSTPSDPSGLEMFRDLLGPPESSGAASFFQTLDAGVREKLQLERERFRKKQEGRVKFKRFLRRNAAVLSGAAIALAVLGLIIQNTLADRAGRPSTRGMTPLEVVETYYGAFGALDHPLMEACVINGAGKSDIDMVTNLFVISRVRQAYEMANPVLPAQEWVDSGAGPTEALVFGVSGLRVEPGDRGGEDGEAAFTASYTRWISDSSGEDPEEPGIGREPPGPPLPQGEEIRDDLRLVRYKEAWRIAEIRRYP
jgi:hypothetical protein